jgi:aminoglycoside 3-N-acetyltransferase
VVLLHSSLRSTGGVVGGAATFVEALLEVVGTGGTLVVPAQTVGNRDPSRWRPPVDPALWPELRDSLPAFDPATSPSEGVGVVAECVRTRPGAVRSSHPQVSFAAVGARAAELLAEHPLESPLGDASPLARMADADAFVLLVGVGFNRCTTFHLAEYRRPEPPMMTAGCAIWRAGRREWVRFETVALDASDFGALGAAFEADSGLVRRGWIGEARARLFPMGPAVAYAQDWFEEHRLAV